MKEGWRKSSELGIKGKGVALKYEEKKLTWKFDFRWREGNGQ